MDYATLILQLLLYTRRTNLAETEKSSQTNDNLTTSI